MTVLEIMERANTRDTNLVIAWIRDGIHAIESTQVENLKVNKQEITKDKLSYTLPTDLISIYSISILDTEEDKWKLIRRISDDPITAEDNSP
tara:strand:+ start:573 stop:848 length:276 start_codon:yes stop_codon:yes gene_type:complete